ncbi:hypothetical protein [Undibacterium sp. Ren11W]|uniref:hypothetical protein n=1 Tax=Undibacterium sp. Ren11W TaxID=3413045 RepID=UPI003BF128FC
MKPRHLVLALALLLAAGVALFGDKTPASGVAEAVARATPTKKMTVANVKSPASTAAVSAKIENIRPRPKFAPEDSMGDNTVASPTAMFGNQNWNPPPPPAAKAIPVALVPPSAPPLPFVYLGKSLADGTWEVFLGRGDRTIIVQNNSLIDGTYRVDAIKPPLLFLTYLPLNQIQQLTIGVLD